MNSRREDDNKPVDRVGAEEDLLPFDPTFESILDALPLGLFILDAHGSPVFANERSTELLGLGPVMELSPAELAAAYSVYVAGTDSPYPADSMPIVKALRGERGFRNDLEIRKKEGSVFLEVEAAPVFDSAGNVNYAVAIFRDVTATRVMETELRMLIDSLESQAIAQETRLEQIKESPATMGALVADVSAALTHAREDARVARNALSLFLANFSHELRTPLNHIIGFSDLIDLKISKGVTTDIGSHAANIKRSGSNLLETLNRIIKFAEMDTGAHVAPDLEIFVADVLLEELVDWATPMADAAQSRVSLTIDEPIGSMRSDSSFIQTALRQLVENACKHSGGGDVRIEAERVGSDAGAILRVVISDEGHGIDPTLVKALLNGHVSPGDPLAAGGLGVGIPLAKRLLEAVGGSLSAESDGRGSTFTVELPVLFRIPEHLM